MGVKKVFDQYPSQSNPRAGYMKEGQSFPRAPFLEYRLHGKE